MNKKHINEVFNELTPDDNKKEIILDSILSEKNMNKSTYKIPVLAFVMSAFIIIVLGSVYYNARFIGSKFINSITLTVYAADKEGDYLTSDFHAQMKGTPLKLNSEVLLARYSPVMSSVPGFPFSFNTDSSYEGYINLSVSSGCILLWDMQSGKITNLGRGAKIKNGEVIYWSPLSEGGTKEDITTITAEIIEKNNILKEEFKIKNDDLNYYVSLKN